MKTRQIGTLALMLVMLVMLAGCGLFLRPTQPMPGGYCAIAKYDHAPVNRCASPDRLQLAVVGDVLPGLDIQHYAYAHGFGAVWRAAAPLMTHADIAIANLEGQVAPGLDWMRQPQRNPGPVAGGRVHTGFPFYNYHPVLLDELKTLGVDVLTTANNHALDRGPAGTGETLDQIRRRGMGAVGSIPVGGKREFVLRRKTPWGDLAFIACTFGLNFQPDTEDQILLCYEDRTELLTLVHDEARRPGNAGVIVLPHWGKENSHLLHPAQERLARDLARAGAIAVIGTHPHQVQPWATFARGGGGEALVAYSTGNFLSSMASLRSETGAMAMIELCPAVGRSGLAVAQAGWIATRLVKTEAGVPRVAIAPRSQSGAARASIDLVERVAPGWSAQPEARCGD